VHDDIMTSLLKKLQISIKIHVVKPLWTGVCYSVWSVSKLSTDPSAVVVSYCEFCSHRRRRRYSTRQLSRVGVGSVYWALGFGLELSGEILDAHVP